MEDFVYVVVLLLISAIPAIQKGIQKKSKPKKKRMSASGNITNVITSDSAISLTFSPEQPEQPGAPDQSGQPDSTPSQDVLQNHLP